MVHDSKLEEDIIARMRQAVAAAEQRGYERGVRETMDKIQTLVMSSASATTYSNEVRTVPIEAGLENDIAQDSTPMTQERKRAPKGLVREVIKRALTAHPGLTPAEMEATAQGDLEKMIRASSYRSELRNGREAGRYREDGGKWFLVEKMKAEDSQTSIPSAFGITTERG